MSIPLIITQRKKEKFFHTLWGRNCARSDFVHQNRNLSKTVKSPFILADVVRGKFLETEVVCPDKQEFENYGLTCRIFLPYSDETVPFAQHLWHPFLRIVDCSIALWQVACAYITG